ncbi:MAG: hypothetical protein Q9O24_04130 [Gammaproteobacteria bacterium]|nr:hypothetical protein [Gammaproteobacteria bacterium]
MATENVITGSSCKSAAKWFSYGNILAMLIPLPFFVLWFGGSIVLYAINRHHPNEKVGEYTQKAAHSFYATAALLVVVATFFPTGIFYYLVFWAVSASYVLPMAIMDIRKINRDVWDDVNLNASREQTQS